MIGPLCHRAYRGLEPIRGAIAGVFIMFGSPGTPIDEGRTRRFTADGLIENNALFDPWQNIPTVTNPAHYREASITGKPGGQRMFARIASPEIDASNTLSLAPRAIPSDARRITRAQVDPWQSTQGKRSWTPGKMAREAVSG